MSLDSRSRLYDAIREVPDFPDLGILFYDVTPLLLRPDLLELAVAALVEPVRDLGVDRIVAIESRGFIFGAPLAMELGAGLVLARKPGKLPWKTRLADYSLEYGADTIEVHIDAIAEGERVLIVDDLLATGGTARAAAQLVHDAKAELVGFDFLIELALLKGRDNLPPGAPVFNVLSYPRQD